MARSLVCDGQACAGNIEKLNEKTKSKEEWKSERLLQSNQTYKTKSVKNTDYGRIEWKMMNEAKCIIIGLSFYYHGKRQFR